MALIREAIISLEEGISDAAGIDTIMKLGMNHPMGPLELSDFIGNDVVYDILNVLYNDLGYERFKPPVTLRNMVYAGKLGRKTGEGFYKYDK
ncbi:3-hydroxyacyl-CoA dehydrogenase family protein [Acidiplasma cupricumulans]|nr:3-hydroxyacyl-CoA dehydrogenase family protein [Acidiplasma cupricumulans]